MARGAARCGTSRVAGKTRWFFSTTPDKAAAGGRIHGPAISHYSQRMKLNTFLPLLAGALTISHGPLSRAEEAQALDIFDGKTLEGWDGDPRFWKVEDG